MGVSHSKPKHELRSCRVAHREYLETGTTTTRKEKVAAKAKKRVNNGAKPTNQRVTALTVGKDADSFSNWSGETLNEDMKEGRH